MGFFFKSIANFGKKVLGGVVGAGNWMRIIRDKAISGFNKVKDMLPDAVNGNPIGRAVKTASGFLDTAVDAGQAALAKLKDHEAQTGMPAVGYRLVTSDL